jgi:hypothetical protein
MLSYFGEGQLEPYETLRKGHKDLQVSVHFQVEKTSCGIHVIGLPVITY